MRETAATTGTSADVGAESAEDLDVSGDASAHKPDGQEDAPHADESVEQTDLADRTAGDGVDVDPELEAQPVDGADPEPSEEGGGAAGGLRGGPAYSRPPGMPPPPDGRDDQADRGWLNPATRAPVGGGPPGRNPAPAERPGAGSLPTAGAASRASAPPAPATTPPAPAGGTGAPTDGPATRSIDPSSAVGSARVHEAVRATRAAAGPRGPRRARLGVKRIDPWSVMKFSFTVSLVLFIVMLVAASVLYLALDTMGVFTSVNNTLAELIESGGGEGEGFRITAQNVIGTAGVLGAINVVLFTALATLGAFIYNVCADLVGGVEVTLAERD